jgi:hypothetical protein
LPTFQFGGISTLQLDAWAPTGVLYGFAGQIELNPGGTTVPGNPILLCSRTTTCPLHAVLDIEPSSQALTVSSGAATSVVSNDGQLVPSVWAENSDVLIAAFGFVLTLLFVTPLTAAIQTLARALGRWLG